MRLPLVALLLPSLALGQRKKNDAAKPGPAGVLAAPLGLPARKSTTVTLRGYQIGQAKGVCVGGVEAKIKPLKKGGAAVPAGMSANTTR